VDLVVYFARAVAGIALLLSAGWKIRHKSAFRASYQALVGGRVSHLDGLAIRTLPYAEIVCGSGLLLRSSVERLAAASSFFVVLSFTLLLARASDFRAGCGCWRTPVRGVLRGPHLIRNACLLALSAVGTASVSNIPPASLLFCLGTGALFAVVIMEIPQVASVAFETEGGQVR